MEGTGLKAGPAGDPWGAGRTRVGRHQTWARARQHVQTERHTFAASDSTSGCPPTLGDAPSGYSWTGARGRVQTLSLGKRCKRRGLQGPLHVLVQAQRLHGPALGEAHLRELPQGRLVHTLVLVLVQHGCGRQTRVSNGGRGAPDACGQGRPGSNPRPSEAPSPAPPWAPGEGPRVPLAFLNNSTASGFSASSFCATSMRDTRIFRSSVWNCGERKTPTAPGLRPRPGLKLPTCEPGPEKTPSGSRDQREARRVRRAGRRGRAAETARARSLPASGTNPTPADVPGRPGPGRHPAHPSRSQLSPLWLH